MPGGSLDILIFGVNAADIELGCGGIIAKMAAEGKTITLVDLICPNQSIRSKKNNAAKILKVDRKFMDFADGPVHDNYDARMKLVEIIRELKPRLVLAPMWEGKEELSRLALGKMLRYACRYARFGKLLPEIPIYRPEGILHYFSPYQAYPPDFLLDVSPHIPIWKEALSCLDNSVELIDHALRSASQRGLMIGKEFAQALAKGNPIEIDDIMSVSKGTLEI